MNHIGDYEPKVGERFRVVKYSNQTDHRYNGKIVTVIKVDRSVDFGIHVVGLSDKNPNYSNNLRAEELAFLAPTITDLGEWM